MADLAVEPDLGAMLNQVESDGDTYIPPAAAAEAKPGPDVVALQAELVASQAREAASAARVDHTRQQFDQQQNQIAIAREQAQQANASAAQAAAYAQGAQSPAAVPVPFDNEAFLDKPEPVLRDYANRVNAHNDLRLQQTVNPLLQRGAILEQRTAKLVSTMHRKAKIEAKAWYESQGWGDFDEDIQTFTQDVENAGMNVEDTMQDLGEIQNALLLMRHQAGKPLGPLTAPPTPPSAGNGVTRTPQTGKVHITKAAADTLRAVGGDPDEIDFDDPVAKELLGAAGVLV